MLINANTHKLLAEAATAAPVMTCWKFVSSDDRRPVYDQALAWRCAR
jgi:hypothetical protein